MIAKSNTNFVVLASFNHNCKSVDFRGNLPERTNEKCAFRYIFMVFTAGQFVNIEL